MIDSSTQLMTKILKMPFPWNVWVAILGLVNMGGGLYYFSTLEGKLAILSLMGAMMIMIVIYKFRGFVRLLGLGHIIFWTPFLFFVCCKLNQKEILDTYFKKWLILVFILNTLSLLIDFFDVWKYYRGDKKELF